MTKSRIRRKGVLIAGLLVLALSVFLVACGGDDDDDSTTAEETTTTEAAVEDTAQADAAAVIEENKAIPEFTLEAEPFDVSGVEGKSIFNIPVASTIPYIAAIDAEMEKIAKDNGVDFTQFNNEGSPTEWAQGMDQAIDQGVDLIILQAGNDPNLVIPQLKSAQEAGIPVLVTHLYQNGEGPNPEVADFIAAIVTVPFWEAARLSVDYAVSESGCDLNAVIITANEVPPSEGIVDAMETQIADRCPDAPTKVINVPVVDWGTKIQPEVQSALQADPDVNWILPIYDSMSLPAEAGIKQVQKGGGEVRIASYNGTPDILKLIQDGDIVVAEMGENINWLGWANMDQAFRILTGSPIIEDGNEETPLRVFDASNVDETGVPPTTNEGYGEAYIEGYEQLWGL
jgi:ribose transport system substrate-binding protein